MNPSGIESGSNISTSKQPKDRKHSLVVVDDDPGFLRLMGKVLKREGYSVRFAERGREATDLCLRERPDLLLMDLNLPDMDGDVLASSCRKMPDPLPFIVMTGQGDERVAVRMMKNGALDYVVKDAEFVELIPLVVRQAIERIDQDRALRQAELQLAESAIRLEKAQAIAGMGSFEVCTRTHFCYHGSSSLASLMGINLEDASMRWDQLFEHCIDEMDRSWVCESFSAFMAHGRDTSIEFRVRPNKAGMEFIQLSGHSLGAVANPDHPIRRLVICRDITERKKLQSEILRISGDERQRIGQDIHDGLCQHLAGLEVMIEALIATPGVQENPSSGPLAREIRQLARQGTQLSRDLAHGLVLYEVDSESWLDAIQNLAGTLSRQGTFSVDLEIEDNLHVESHATANALFRVTQEAITNARKHAHCSRVRVSIFSCPHWIELKVSDNGDGFDDEDSQRSRGLGIHLMQYRAETAGGHLTLRSKAGQGTSVEARFPIPVETPSPQHQKH